MLGELLSALLFGQVTGCDTARAAVGSCSSQLSAGLVSGSGFALNLSREITSATSSTLTTISPGSLSGGAGGQAAQPSASQPTRRPLLPSAAPPRSAPKPAASASPARAAAAKPTASTKPPARALSPQCPILDPPLARFHQAPCPSTPRPAAKPVPPKPPVGAVPNSVRPAPLPQTQAVASPARSSATSSTSQTRSEQQTLAGFAPSVDLALSGVARVGSELEFVASTKIAQESGQLFGTAAIIRFTPVSATISFGDGQLAEASAIAGGFESAHSYRAPGRYLAQALVRFRVDYRLGGNSWVVGAAEVVVGSNSLNVDVLQPPRRTLLVP